ncbi:SDR family oxidoreductase [Nonomuraea turkmeniaca]|uniref:SDR family oxidoreductase n=1 Tax=Nonomuraea turkmeniaca TaxID=103838 RepID=A0A5S4FJ13_9ACTN|nr:SDR family oxidoreductase [Nonomuraea turkmeniaca]TMR20737.1 SDR family oxidoreductase [Nonomuraea turkmeniaca]
MSSTALRNAARNEPEEGQKKGHGLVFGSRGGIGSEISRILSHKDINVHGIDRAEMSAHGINEWALDVTQPGLETWLEDHFRNHGLPRFFVWCIGVYDRRPLTEYGTVRMRTVLDTNLTALLVALRTVVAAAVEQRSPLRVVVVGSQASVNGGTDAVYAAAKAGCVAAVKSVAREYGRHGITANIVSPGPTNTTMAEVMGDERRRHYESTIPIGRFTEPLEVAAAAVWLLTEAPPAITGTVLDVDGGLVRR